MMKAVIFDIDGTLADNDHRQYLVDCEKPDWESFFFHAEKDIPNISVVSLYNLIRKAGAFELLLVSARPERHRELTEKWLAKYDIVYSSLYMRADGDRRADYIIKKEILDKILQQGKGIAFVVDDRNETVKMWRDNGLTCLQCADHDY